jgi:hypothetical protein
VNVAGKLRCVGIGLNQDRLVTALQKMTCAVVLDVEIGGIGTVDVFHDLGQVAEWRLYHEMIVIAHQAVGVEYCIVPLGGRSKVGKELFTIRHAFKDVLLFVPPGQGMIKSPRIFDPQRPCQKHTPKPVFIAVSCLMQKILSKV